MPRKAKWLRVDERVDVISSLSLCLDCLEQVGTKPTMWKWAILSLHNAFQGAMVCHLSGTAQLGALTKKSAIAWVDWHDRDRRGQIERIPDGVDKFGIPRFRFAARNDHPPLERLADSKELFIRLSNARERFEDGVGAVLNITQEQSVSFKRLHSLRNDFSHFTPKGWAIELRGLPTIFLDVVHMIREIAGDPWSFRHLSKRQRQNLSGLIRKLASTLKSLHRS